MFTIKNMRLFFLVMAMLVISLKVKAQNIDEKIYLRKMHLIDSLSFYRVDKYDTLYHVSTSISFNGQNYNDNYYGWINDQNSQNILFLKINGKELKIKKGTIKIDGLPLNEATIDTLINRQNDLFSDTRGDFAADGELILWLYKKGKIEYSQKLFRSERILLGDTDKRTRDGFGSLYYDAMLQAYSYGRDYGKAIAFGEHLSRSIFNGFEYQKVAMALTNQLKSYSEDFKTFRLPDSVGWAELRQKLNRKDQIIYLADRLRLLNCIQPGQPAGVSYSMYQYSIPYDQSVKLKGNYWEYDAGYTVINPFNELLTMRLSLNEVELLLPYLLKKTYIPSYNYHRDFFPQRNLHELSWVIESLIFEITHKAFFERLSFDSLTPEQKKAEIQKIQKWCDENATLSPESLTVKQLRAATNWTDFYAAMQTARQQKNDSLLSILVKRFNDFYGGLWPTNRGIIAQTMYELGNGEYIDAVRKWNKDTTDKWVSLWTSMFLIKYDKGSYKPALDELEDILKQCDGVSYYPHAMDLLLSLNDKRAFSMAEGILSKSGFQRMMDWDYYANFIRKLLHAKSDYTFGFLSAKLDDYTADKMNDVHKDNDHMLAEEDNYVLAVSDLKDDKKEYFTLTTNVERLKYIKALDKWFKTQYGLLKEGKFNELHLDPKLVNAPVTFIDSYYR